MFCFRLFWLVVPRYRLATGISFGSSWSLDLVDVVSKRERERGRAREVKKGVLSTVFPHRVIALFTGNTLECTVMPEGKTVLHISPKERCEAR